MKYKITITKIEERQVSQEGPYDVIDKRPWTHSEINDKNFYGESAEQWILKNPLKEVRGYQPTRTVTKTEEVELLKQTVETLDLAAVIKAVNGL